MAPVWKARGKGIRFPTPRYISQKSGSRVRSNGSRSSGLISSIFVLSTRARITHRGHEGVGARSNEGRGFRQALRSPHPDTGSFRPYSLTISRPAARSVRRKGAVRCSGPSDAGPPGAHSPCPRAEKGFAAAFTALAPRSSSQPPGGGPEPCGRSRSLRAWSWQPSFAGIGDIEHHQSAWPPVVSDFVTETSKLGGSILRWLQMVYVTVTDCLSISLNFSRFRFE